MFQPRGNYQLQNHNLSINRKFCEIQKRAGVDIGLLTGVGIAPILLRQHHRVLDYLIFNESSPSRYLDLKPDGFPN